MFYCERIRPLWMRLQALLWGAEIVCVIDPATIIFNDVHDQTNHVTNLIVLICKQFIYRYKCQDKIPNFEALKAEIVLNYKIERFNYGKKASKRWLPVKTIFKLED